MNVTIEKQIFSKIKKAKRGVAFFADDFLAFGNACLASRA